jgi:hypothetical protein
VGWHHDLPTCHWVVGNDLVGLATVMLFGAD